MEDIKIVYELTSDIWKLFKQFECKQLNDEQWQRFIDAGLELQDKYRKLGKKYELLFRDLFLGIQNYYERLKG